MTKPDYNLSDEAGAQQQQLTALFQRMQAAYKNDDGLPAGCFTSLTFMQANEDMPRNEARRIIEYNERAGLIERTGKRWGTGRAVVYRAKTSEANE